jgi:hypothetical protein
VALTFDDGPDRSSTPAFLDLLRDEGIQATFFVLGRMLRMNPEIGSEIAAAGHEIAVHGWNHRPTPLSGPMTAYDDLARTTDLVSVVTGTRPRWYRDTRLGHHDGGEGPPARRDHPAARLRLHERSRRLAHHPRRTPGSHRSRSGAGTGGRSAPRTPHPAVSGHGWGYTDANAYGYLSVQLPVSDEDEWGKPCWRWSRGT